MQKKIYVTTFLLICGFLTLSACGASEPQETVPGATPTLADENGNDALLSTPASSESDNSEVDNNPENSNQPTSTALPPDSAEIEESYPPPPQLPAPDLPEGYPAPPEPLPTIDAYPGGLVWVLHPVGVQCEEGTLPGYGDVKQAQATLSDGGVLVKSIEMTDLMVTAQCGGPTSTHYRAQIGVEEQETAVALGWQLEN